MKTIHFVFLFIATIVPNLSFSFDTSVKGFIALDALNFEKIQNKPGAAVIGIGVLDLKVFAEQEDITAAIKLDLDGKLSEDLNIFEEAYASYRGIRNLKFSLGKSVVKFQNLHWGAIMNTYLDGGSVLGTENNWRKVNRKAFISASYGHYNLGYLDTFTIWGDSNEIDYDENGNPKLTTTSPKTYKTTNVPAFTTEKQLGLGNKLELYHHDTWTYTLGQIYYKNRQQDKPSWALDFGTKNETSDFEMWTDLLFGFTTKAPYEKYTTFRKYEYFAQLGAEKYLNEKWSIVGNTEYLFVRDQRHTVADAQNQDGSAIKTTNYKIESCFKYKLSKTAFLTMGALFEKKIAEQNGVKNLSRITGVYNANVNAYKAATSISFWF